MLTELNQNIHTKYGNTIHRQIIDDSETYTYYPIAVIGASEAGIAVGCRLREELGFDQFRILERQNGIGGSWWINRFPGIVCSNPSIFRSKLFSSFNGNAITFPTGQEILNYLQAICEKHRIVDKIQLNADVRECRWLESEQIWELKVWDTSRTTGNLVEHDRTKKIRDDSHESVYGTEEKIRVRILVNAAGNTIEPKPLLKDVPGLKNFRGEIFHSIKWKNDIDLTDKEIIVLGTSSSAAQFVPLLIDKYGARSVTQLMRSPPWVVPSDYFLSKINQRWNRWWLWLTQYIPGIDNITRCYLAAKSEREWEFFGPSTYTEKQSESLEHDLQTYMKKTVPKKYHEILTPDHRFECRRWVIDTDWLHSLNSPAVTLTTLPLSSIGETDITLGPGRLYPDPHDSTSRAPNHEVTIPADVIILANESDTTASLYPLRIIGRENKNLHDIFNEKRGSHMYMGMALDGFPNFFTVLSPNTMNGNSSTVLASENTLSLCFKFLKPLLEEEFSIVEIRQEAELRWSREAQIALEKMMSKIESHNSWYFDESGRGIVVYPHPHIWFTLRSIFPNWSDWNISLTNKGRVKDLARKSLHTLAFAVTLLSLVRLRTRRNFLLSVKNFIQVILFSSSNLLYNTGSKIR